MSFFDTLTELLERPESVAASPRPAGLGRAAMLGYAAGALGLFAFLRLYAAVPPGVMSYAAALLLVLALNFLFAGIIHLFMDLTGSGAGSASGLFLAFGLSDYFMCLLVPLAFFAKLGFLGAPLWLCLCALLVLDVRLRLVRRLYPVARNKAALAVVLPYLWFWLLSLLAFTYGLAWLVWLLV